MKSKDLKDYIAELKSRQDQYMELSKIEPHDINMDNRYIGKAVATMIIIDELQRMLKGEIIL